MPFDPAGPPCQICQFLTQSSCNLKDSIEFLKCFACGKNVANPFFQRKTAVANEVPKAVVQPMMKRVETRPPERSKKTKDINIVKSLDKSENNKAKAIKRTRAEPRLDEIDFFLKSPTTNDLDNHPDLKNSGRKKRKEMRSIKIIPEKMKKGYHSKYKRILNRLDSESSVDLPVEPKKTNQKKSDKKTKKEKNIAHIRPSSQAPKKHDMESEGASDSESDNFDSEDSSEDEVCAECNKVHKGLWIQCDICNQWFCEDCVPIIKSLQRRGEDFYCDAVFCQRGKRIRDRADQPSKVTRPRLTKLSTV